MKPAFTVAVLFALASGLLSAGCGGTATSGDEGRARTLLRAVGVEYGRYLGQHNGAPPSDEAAFRAFVDAQIAQTKDYGVASAEELLLSPRDGKPVKVIVGAKVTAPDQPDLPWAAYEQTGVDGKRLAVNARGTVVEFSSEEFSQAIPLK